MGPAIQGQGRRRVAFTDKLQQLLEGFFSGLGALSPTQAAKQSLNLGPVTRPQLIAHVAFGMDQTLLLNRLRPPARNRRLDRGAPVPKHQ